jgi:hypothetical protein
MHMRRQRQEPWLSLDEARADRMISEEKRRALSKRVARVVVSAGHKRIGVNIAFAYSAEG